MQRIDSVLPRYFLWTYWVVVLALAGNLRAAATNDGVALSFAATVALSYSALYLAPLALVCAALQLTLARLPRLRAPLVGGLAVLGPAALEIGIVSDARLYELYGFHLNGMVWNLLTTRGGIESVDGDPAFYATCAALVAGCVALQAGLFALALRRSPTAPSPARRRRVRIALALLVAVSLLERSTYAWAFATGRPAVLRAADAFPFYLPTRARMLARWLGVAPVKEETLIVDTGPGALHYPLRPIERSAHRPYNVVFLVAESLRADALTPEFMPATDAFARRALRFRSHYSGGNCTRMGVFSLFYGLYGSYWFPFHDQERGPLLMDVLLDDGYELDLRTSAKFTYPEFDETVFVRAPRERMHAATDAIGWRSDERHVDRLLEFLAHRDASRPFLSFLFFESPHARYEFPEADAIHQPYLESVNYATLDVERDMPLLKNRYWNAVHHLDRQLARVFAALEAEGLLHDTIVVVTGDHGEEFMEKGRWGHGSGFSEEQTRVPLVLYVPGRPPAVVDAMTSHVDVAPTLLRLLGVENPPSDYSLGVDLLAETPRPWTVVSGWDVLAFVSPRYKLVLPMGSSAFALRSTLTTREDVPVLEPAPLLRQQRGDVLSVLRQLQRFQAPRG